MVLIADSYDRMSVTSSDRHFKIKKNKSEIESLPKEEVINCSCGSNQEDGLMIQVIKFVLNIRVDTKLKFVIHKRKFYILFLLEVCKKVK